VLRGCRRKRGGRRVARHRGAAHGEPAGRRQNGALTPDATSTWTVTADSTLTSLSGARISGPTSAGSTITNFVGNGHTVTYDATLAANGALGGGTYSLAGGGTLTPA
jgi:hypothetical protein